MEVGPLPYEELVRKVMGNNWREASQHDIDGAVGVAIIRAVLDRTPKNYAAVATKLGIKRECVAKPFDRLSLNGAFLAYNLERDRDLLDAGDEKTWCHYASIASGDKGNVGVRSNEARRQKHT